MKSLDDAPETGSGGRLSGVLAAACVLAVYLVVFYVMPKHVFWSPDEGGRFIELRSIGWDGGLAYSIPYPGRHLDPEYRFYPTPRVYPELEADGSVRLPWPIWFPLLSRIAFAVFGLTGIYLIPLLSGWGIALVCGWVTAKLGSPLAPLTILVVGLASPVFFYSMTFWEHTLASLLALIGVAIVVVAGGRAPALFAALPFVLAACVLRLEMFALLPVILLAVPICNLRARIGGGAASGARRVRQQPVMLAGAAAIVVMIAAFLLSFPPWRWGFVSGPRMRWEGLAFLPRIPGGLLEVIINTANNHGPSVDPAWSSFALLAAVTIAIAAFSRRPGIEATLLFPAFVFVLGLSGWILRSPEEYRAMHGILPIAPYLALGWYVLPSAWRKPDRARLLMALQAALYMLSGIAAIILFYVGSRGLQSTLEWGQRYLLTIYPLFAILAVLAFGTYWRSSRPRAQRIAFAALFVVAVWIGFQFQLRGLGSLYRNRELLAAWDRELRVPHPVVTDLWWLPTAVADLSTSRDLFVARDRPALGEWIATAQRHGVRTFTFATLTPLPEGDSWPPGVRVQKSWKRRGLWLAELEISDLPAN